jgi:hypothetical protein
MAAAAAAEGRRKRSPEKREDANAAMRQRSDEFQAIPRTP